MHADMREDNHVRWHYLMIGTRTPGKFWEKRIAAMTGDARLLERACNFEGRARLCLMSPTTCKQRLGFVNSNHLSISDFALPTWLIR